MATYRPVKQPVGENAHDALTDQLFAHHTVGGRRIRSDSVPVDYTDYYFIWPYAVLLISSRG